MNGRLQALAVGAALILATACGRERGGAAGTTYDRAVAAGQAMQADPTRTDSILMAHGFTGAAFDAFMYEVAGDSALARAYTEAIH
jgi:hypothetical protein